MSYHTMIQHPIGQWSVFGVLAVQVLTDHLDVGLLTHLLSRFHPKADVASVNKYKRGLMSAFFPYQLHWLTGCDAFCQQVCKLAVLLRSYCVSIRMST